MWGNFPKIPPLPPCQIVHHFREWFPHREQRLDGRLVQAGGGAKVSARQEDDSPVVDITTDEFPGQNI